MAAKLGFPGRLVTYNPGVAQTFLYTTHQDYWSGELVNLRSPATARYLDNGLQWFGWTCLEDRAWVHHRLDTEVPKPLYSDEEVISYVRTCNSHQAPMTFSEVSSAMPPCLLNRMARFAYAAGRPIERNSRCPTQNLGGASTSVKSGCHRWLPARRMQYGIATSIACVRQDLLSTPVLLKGDTR